MLRGIAFSLSILVAVSGQAFAEGIQAQCGAETGRAYAAVGGVVRADQGGWYDDRMTGETVMRIDTDTGEVDLRFKDATGVWQSSVDQGGNARLFSVESDPSTIMVVVVYPYAIEVLTLANIDGSAAVLIHTASRSTPVLTNSRVMTADCQITRY